MEIMHRNKTVIMTNDQMNLSILEPDRSISLHICQKAMDGKAKYQLNNSFNAYTNLTTLMQATSSSKTHL